MGDFYAKDHGLKWKIEKKFGALMTRDGDVLFAKPQLFYNLTGQSVASIMKFYKISNKDLLIICDDLNMEFGKIRFRGQGSDGGNNGLKSIISHIGSDFARLRIGTSNELKGKMPDADFVLSRFSKDEQSQLPTIHKNVTAQIDEFINK